MRPIKVGDTLPKVTLQLSSPADTVDVQDLFSNKKAILITVPGAFTPGCTKSHLPGYIKEAERLKETKGVDLIACATVNDAFVTTAWGKALHNDDVTLLADPKGEFAKALDLDFDASGALGNRRFKRSAMILENGVVTHLFEEPDKTGLDVSLVENVEKHL
ncbi:Redoxin [Hesseltinella vesiculosa]|uniref:Thioredoxin-dependent peroxiredoxin n=1 Tax=Hesseltinella vesiculosa TaxID=101127 RepID=A0A1X2G9S1_9FUNG|nr:Redoxin [Hesseltinella vesiculosa]